MKSRFELSLDHRQVLALFVGMVVLLGVVFAVGVMVGRSLKEFAALPPEAAAPSAREAEPPRPAARPAANLAPAPGSPTRGAATGAVEFTFYETLRGRAPTAPAGTPPPPTSAAAAKPAEGRSAPPAPEKPEKREVAPQPTGRFLVQVGSFNNKKDADARAVALGRKNVPAFVSAAEIAGRGSWWRVRIGRFATREDAIRYGSALAKREPGIDSFVVVTGD